MGADCEIIFVEGGSHDGTLEECLRVQALYPHLKIQVLVQDGVGKGDAVRKGFAHATNELLLILDADLSVQPEDLPLFLASASEHRGLVVGSRFVYPMEKGAMPLLNNTGNRFFTVLLNFILGEDLSDTLCGTKVILKSDYQEIRSRRVLGDADPYGDFELLFGAANLGLPITELPLSYRSRTYGKTQIRRFRDGWILLRLAFIGWRHLGKKRSR
jgi:glycosyltransferase involved in cell wall biosynthesis